MKNGNTWLYKASLDLHDTDEPPLPSQDHRPLYGPSIRWQQARSHSSLCSLPCPAGPRVDVMPRVNLVSPPLQAMELWPEFGPQVPSPPLWLGLLQAAPVLVTLGQFLQDRKAPSEQVNRGFFHSRKEQALLVTDIRIFSPWRWWFLSANHEGNLGWPPHREMPGIEQDKSHIPDASRTHGFKVVISNVLMFPPATPVRCLQIQCVTSCERRSSGRQGNQTSAPNSCGAEVSSASAVTFLLLKTFATVEQELPTTQRVNTLMCMTFVYVLLPTSLLLGRNPSLRSNSLQSEY